MARRLVISTICPLCGNKVEEVPDRVLKQNPHHKNAEFVVTNTGRKQYIHTSCWNKMIEKQKKKVR